MLRKIIKVSEKWDYVHSQAIMDHFHAILHDLGDAKLFVTQGESYSSYDVKGAPTKYFLSQEAAEPYLSYIRSLKPVELKIEEVEEDVVDWVNQYGRHRLTLKRCIDN